MCDSLNFAYSLALSDSIRCWIPNFNDALASCWQSKGTIIWARTDWKYIVQSLPDPFQTPCALSFPFCAALFFSAHLDTILFASPLLRTRVYTTNRLSIRYTRRVFWAKYSTTEKFLTIYFFGHQKQLRINNKNGGIVFLRCAMVTQFDKVPAHR